MTDARRPALLLGVFLVLSFGLLAACSDDSGGRSVFDLEVGDCFDDPTSTGTVQDVPIVDCAEPHDNEVTHLFDVEGDEFPGEDTIRTEAEATCEEEFANYVGVPFSESELTGGALLVPTEQSWENGDREVVCAVWNPDFSKLEGSVEGTER